MRVLSGIQPTGRFHLGNYLGMIRQAIELQKDNEVFLFIADLHALTTLHNREAMQTNVRSAVLDLIACGFDVTKGYIFIQSEVPEVTELAWYLSVVTPVGLLERCHSYKDKVSKGANPTHGLFSYPVLMAADILAYDSDLVPVGKDQKQHLEVTRDIAQKFNNIFGKVFKIPEPLIKDDVAVVPGIDGQKMSKSYDNHLEIFGDPNELKKRIMRIVTDCKGVSDPKDPQKCNIFKIYSLLASTEEIKELEDKYRSGGFGYAEAKKLLFNKFMDYFAPMRKRRTELEQDISYVEMVLKDGRVKARLEAQRVLDRVRSVTGVGKRLWD